MLLSASNLENNYVAAEWYNNIIGEEVESLEGLAETIANTGQNKPVFVHVIGVNCPHCTGTYKQWNAAAK